jgi:transcriptional regulator with XRE-family HTH domain
MQAKEPYRYTHCLTLLYHFGIYNQMSLSAYLETHGLTCEEFGKLLGVTGTAVSRYARGTRLPEPDIMRKIYIATKGRVQPDDFYDLPVRQPKARCAVDEYAGQLGLFGSNGAAHG